MIAPKTTAKKPAPVAGKKLTVREAIDRTNRKYSKTLAKLAK